jgi:hypothetical protein
MGEPTVTRVINREGRWTVTELAAVFPPTLGLDLVNPAPTQSPKDAQAAKPQ